MDKLLALLRLVILVWVIWGVNHYGKLGDIGMMIDVFIMGWLAIHSLEDHDRGKS